MHHKLQKFMITYEHRHILSNVKLCSTFH